MVDFIILKDFLHMMELVDNIEPIPRMRPSEYRKGIEVLRDRKYCGDVLTEALEHGFFKDRERPAMIDFKEWIINDSKVIKSFLKNR